MHTQVEGTMSANYCTVCHVCVRAQGPTARCALQVELEGMREAHLRDAVALSDLLSFLEREVSRSCSAVRAPATTSLQSGRRDGRHGFLLMQVAAGRVFSEVEVDAELQKRRGAQAGYLDSSFPTIAGEKFSLPQQPGVQCCASTASRMGVCPGRPGCGNIMSAPLECPDAACRLWPQRRYHPLPGRAV